MRKILVKVVISTVIIICVGFFVTLHLRAVCTEHDYVWGNDGISMVRLYTHSHYKQKNGIWGYWPCIVYDKRQNYKLYCIECGYV